MLTKEEAKKLNDSLKLGREIIFHEYELIDGKFKKLLEENGEFDAGGSDYELTYTGCDFPTRCKVEKIYLSEDGNTIYVELKDVECENEVFDVPITDLESTTMYGDHILNLFGLAIAYFQK